MSDVCSTVQAAKRIVRGEQKEQEEIIMVMENRRVEDIMIGR